MASDSWDWEERIRELEVRLRDEFRTETAKVLAKVERLESELRLSKVTRLHISEPASWSPDSANGELEVEVEDPAEQWAQKVQPQVPKPQTLQESKPKEEMKGTGPTEPTDEAQEPIPFTESTWNLLLVLGFTKAGWIDILIGCGVFLGSLLLQGGLCYVLLTGDFLGKPLTLEIEVAKRWRAGTAHDFKHLDIAETSLVSRVCNGDGSLIMSTQQAAFISQLNTYLGMQASELAPEGICPGSVLCVLCISWWCLYLGREYRQIFSSLEGWAFCCSYSGFNVKRSLAILSLFS